MLQGLRDVPSGSSSLPFVSMFYGTALQGNGGGMCGRVHTIAQAAGGKQGDAMTPLLFSVGVQSQMKDEEVLRAFLDGIYTVSLLDSVGAVHRLLAAGLWNEAGIRVRQGKDTGLEFGWRDAPWVRSPPDRGGFARSDGCGVARVRRVANTPSWHEGVRHPFGPRQIDPCSWRRQQPSTKRSSTASHLLALAPRALRSGKGQ